MHRLFLLSTLAIFTIAGTAVAGQDRPTEAWAGGVLVRVDASAGTFDVKQGAHEQTYTLGPDAELIKDKKPVQVAELASGVGHQVTIRYATVGGDRVVNRVNVLGPRKESSARTTKSSPAQTASPQ